MGMPFFLREVPTYEPLGDIIRVVRCGEEIFVPLAIASRIVAALNRAIDECHAQRGTVRAIKPLRKV